MSSPHTPRVLVTFLNRSCSLYRSISIVDAYDYAATKVSYGSVTRVELLIESRIRVLWDNEWSPDSQKRGLTCPK